MLLCIIFKQDALEFICLAQLSIIVKHDVFIAPIKKKKTK